jgi:hypothetical protein
MLKRLLRALFSPRRYFRLRQAQRRVLASQGQALDRWPAPTDPKAKLASYLTDDHTEPLEAAGAKRKVATPSPNGLSKIKADR